MEMNAWLKKKKNWKNVLLSDLHILAKNSQKRSIFRALIWIEKFWMSGIQMQTLFYKEK